MSVVNSLQIGGQTGLINQKTELRGRLLSLGGLNEKKSLFLGGYQFTDKTMFKHKGAP